MDWYNYTWNYVVKALNSDVYYGLKDEQIEDSREQYGGNTIKTPEHRPIVCSIFNQLKNLWIIVFIIDMALLFYGGNYKLCILVTGFFMINLILMSIFEQGKFKGLKEIDRLNNYNVRIIRNGNDMVIPVEELVVGDIVYVNRGSIVPADLRIIKSNNLKVKENAVTGENYIVDKYETKIEEKDISLFQMSNMLFRSSYVHDGEGMGVVVATGMNTQIGNIINISFSSNEKNHDFNKNLVKSFNFTALILLVLTGIFFFIDFKSGVGIKNGIFSAGSFLIIGTTNTLIGALYVAYAFIIFKLNKEKVFLKNIHSLYGISDMDIVTFEKVGTLGENVMNLKKIYVNHEIQEVEQVSFHMDEEIERLISIGLLCSNAKYNMSTGEEKGELEDVELMRFFRVYSIFKNSLEVKYPRIAEIPMDSTRRTMTTINKIDENYRANVKGFLDYILERCTHIRVNGIEREITKEDIFKIKNINIELCGQSLNVVALASRAFSYEPSLNENIESNLVFEGLLAFYNPLKECYEEKLNYYKSNCIKPVFITKENKLTAYAMGKKLKLLTNVDGVLSGVEINYMNEEELNYSVGKANILSHVDHKSKAKVAEKLKEKGYNIAMTGKNLKDLAYLMHCYISIAISKNCSNTLKKICDAFVEEFNLESCKNLINGSRRFKKFCQNACLYLTYGLVCEGSNILAFKIMNPEYALPKYLYLYINIISMSIMFIVLFKEALYVPYSEEIRETAALDKNIIKSIIFGIIPFIVFRFLLYRGIDISTKICFLILNFFISVIPLTFSDKENIFFRYKLSNIMFVLNIILSCFIFLFKI